jgi:transcriptional regulator with XRE-family HTH domain
VSLWAREDAARGGWWWTVGDIEEELKRSGNGQRGAPTAIFRSNSSTLGSKPPATRVRQRSESNDRAEMSRLGCWRGFEVSILSASRAARFGQIIRARRRQLDLTLEEVAKRIKTSQQFVGRLESGKKGPSQTIVKRLAKVLGFDVHTLFFLVHPLAHATPNLSAVNLVLSARKRFKNDNLVRRFHNISDGEMEMLSHVASLGEVRSADEFIYVLNAVRIAIYPALEDHVGPAWDQFKDDYLLRRLHSISDAEMGMLSCVALLGEVRSAREFLYVLNAVRQVIGS